MLWLAWQISVVTMMLTWLFIHIGRVCRMVFIYVPFGFAVYIFSKKIKWGNGNTKLLIINKNVCNFMPHHLHTFAHYDLIPQTPNGLPLIITLSLFPKK